MVSTLGEVFGGEGYGEKVALLNLGKQTKTKLDQGWQAHYY